MSLGPEYVRARKRRMAAQIDFVQRREPSEAARARGGDEGGLGEVHLRSDELHPSLPSGHLEQAHRGGIASIGLGAKGVDLEDRKHGPIMAPPHSEESLLPRDLPQLMSAQALQSPSPIETGGIASTTLFDAFT